MTVARHPIKDSVYALLTGNASLVALLGDAKAITAQWPDGNLQFTPSSIGDDYPNLPPVFPPRARVTFVLVAPQKDIHTPARNDLFQVDVWSPNPELREAIVQSIEALDQTALTVANGRVTEMLIQRGPDLYEPDTRIHHTPINLRVLWTL